MALTQTNVGIAVLKQNQDNQQQMIAMLAQQTAMPPQGTGVLLNAHG